MPPTTAPLQQAAPTGDRVAPPSESSEAQASGTPETTPTGPTNTEATNTEEPTSGPETASSSVSQAARAIETLKPQTLEAPQQDVALAESAKPISAAPAPALTQDVEKIANVIDVKSFRGGQFRDAAFRDGRDDSFRDRRGPDTRRGNDRFAGNHGWDHRVRQWDRNWVRYDDYYRPVISNPFRQPVQIIYVVQNRQRIVRIPPLARVVLSVAELAAYSFTAVVTNPINQVVNVAVGSFFGGGFIPRVGLPLPLPPRPVARFDNVPVQVRYSNQTFEPFRVQRIVDVGNDARFGERKVLLDGVTPAWGEWTQARTGERQFEVHRTQQFPGLDEPREAPLPGDYQLRLLSDESTSSGLNRRDVYLIAVAGLCAVLSLSLISFVIGRRRRA